MRVRFWQTKVAFLAGDGFSAYDPTATFGDGASHISLSSYDA